MSCDIQIKKQCKGIREVNQNGFQWSSFIQPWHQTSQHKTLYINISIYKVKHVSDDQLLRYWGVGWGVCSTNLLKQSTNIYIVVSVGQVLFTEHQAKFLSMILQYWKHTIPSQIDTPLCKRCVAKAPVHTHVWSLKGWNKQESKFSVQTISITSSYMWRRTKWHTNRHDQCNSLKCSTEKNVFSNATLGEIGALLGNRLHVWYLSP